MKSHDQIGFGDAILAGQPEVRAQLLDIAARDQSGHGHEAAVVLGEPAYSHTSPISTSSVS